jgi:Holliday junction resolvase RusA-like endonuclease
MLENRHQPAYEGDVYVEVQYYTRKLRSWDIDNRLKILQDCLALSGIIKDDRQIMRTTTEKLWTNGGEYTVIEVRKLPEGMYARPALKAKRERPCVAKA